MTLPWGLNIVIPSFVMTSISVPWRRHSVSTVSQKRLNLDDTWDSRKQANLIYAETSSSTWRHRYDGFSTSNYQNAAMISLSSYVTNNCWHTSALMQTTPSLCIRPSWKHFNFLEISREQKSVCQIQLCYSINLTVRLPLLWDQTLWCNFSETHVSTLSPACFSESH